MRYIFYFPFLYTLRWPENPSSVGLEAQNRSYNLPGECTSIQRKYCFYCWARWISATGHRGARGITGYSIPAWSECAMTHNCRTQIVCISSFCICYALCLIWFTGHPISLKDASTSTSNVDLPLMENFGVQVPESTILDSLAYVCWGPPKHTCWCAWMVVSTLSDSQLYMCRATTVTHSWWIAASLLWVFHGQSKTDTLKWLLSATYWGTIRLDFRPIQGKCCARMQYLHTWKMVQYNILALIWFLTIVLNEFVKSDQLRSMHPSSIETNWCYLKNISSADVVCSHTRNFNYQERQRLMPTICQRTPSVESSATGSSLDSWAMHLLSCEMAIWLVGSPENLDLQGDLMYQLSKG